MFYFFSGSIIIQYMEVVYILISIVEIIVTCFLVINLHNLTKKLEGSHIYADSFTRSFLDFARIIKLTSEITVLGKKYIKKTKYLRKFISALQKILSTAFAIDILKGKHKIIKLPSILRKLLFFI